MLNKIRKSRGFNANHVPVTSTSNIGGGRFLRHKTHPASIVRQIGFTLIELLVVISIIGVLVAIGIVSYQKTAQLSRDSKRKGDLEQVRQALETYRSENGFYPRAGSNNVTLSAIGSGYLETDYIQKLPEDPKSYTYRYVVPGANPVLYSLCAYLEISPSMTLSRCGSSSCTGGTCNYEVQNP